MGARVRICGSEAAAVAAAFTQRGCSVQQAAAVAAYPTSREADALVLAPGRGELGETAAALSRVGLNRRRPVLGVFLATRLGEAGYGFLRRGADEIGSEPGPFAERVIARVECREHRAVLYAERGANAARAERNRLRGGLESVADSVLRLAPAALRAAGLRDLVARIFGSAEGAPGRGSAAREVRDDRAAPGRARPRVLVVEDDPHEREGLRELLSVGFEVVAAGSADEARRELAASTPDVVLLDVLLPGVDGLAMLDLLRHDPRTAELPVFVISGLDDEALKVRAFEAGASDYLCKPFAPRELLARIDRSLRLARERQQLREQAQTDAHTGLPNYRAFKARLVEEIGRARRYGTDLACVMVDLDGLKAINDQHGHAAGSRAIVALADVLRCELRATDFAARCGGDEFVALLPHARANTAAVFAERVRAALAALPVASDGVFIPVRASFGVAAMERGDDPDALLARADAALYLAKARGRDCVALADSLAPERVEPPATRTGEPDARPGVVSERRG